MRTLQGLLILCVVVLTLLLATTLWNVTDSPTWSYIILAPSDENLIKELNAVGSIGFEVVFARRASDGDPTNPSVRYEMILKRPGGAPIPTESPQRPE